MLRHPVFSFFQSYYIVHISSPHIELLDIQLGSEERMQKFPRIALKTG